MSVNQKMQKIADNIRYRTEKSGLLGLDSMANEIKGINWVEDPFFAKASPVDSVSQMTDTSKIYVLTSTGSIWMYRNGGSIVETVTERIVGTTDNPWGAGRLSSGNPNGTSGYVTTPYIDLQKYSVPFELHLKGIKFAYNTDGNRRWSSYGTDKAHLRTELTQPSAFTQYWRTATCTVTGDEAVISFAPPLTNETGTQIGFARFSGKGTEADADVYITYENVTSTESGWVDTGIQYPFAITSSADLLIPNQSVKSFMASAEYEDGNYSYTQVTQYATSGGVRKDVPNPFNITWEDVENTALYAVSVNATTYYTEGNSINVFNLLPGTQYLYTVYSLQSDGSMVAVKRGEFSTTSDRTRMLNIDGIQNVRDVGGYVGLNGKKVRYGLLFRGSAMDEGADDMLRITEAGKQEMLLRLGIKTDLDLRYEPTESALGDSVDFIKTATGYGAYVEAITNATQRGNFKTLFESIVTQLRASKPIYIHCSGGCDRTGTLVFLLLGLLGVSESDLAKEYELSSFSTIGQGRRRDSTTYDYKGMVAAVKAYGKATFSENFAAFAETCGAESTAIARFRNLMLR